MEDREVARDARAVLSVCALRQQRRHLLRAPLCHCVPQLHVDLHPHKCVRDGEGGCSMRVREELERGG
eukprot:3829929-Rhodomonas_salina.1